MSRFGKLLPRFGKDFFRRIDAASGYIFAALSNGFFDTGLGGRIQKMLVVLCH
jgi:hypothetical protein